MPMNDGIIYISASATTPIHTIIHIGQKPAVKIIAFMLPDPDVYESIPPLVARLSFHLRRTRIKWNITS